MADFLTHLIARSFELGPRLQRRVPALFEPPVDDAALAEPAPSSTERPREPAAPGDPAQSAEARASGPTLATVREEAVPAVASAPRTELHVQPIEIGRGPVPAVEPAPPGPSAVPPASKIDVLHLPAMRDRREGAHHPSLRAPVAGSLVLEREVVRETRVDRTVVAPSVPGRTPRPLPGVAAPGPYGGYSRRSAPREPLASDAGSLEPTIHVTIGRVEVRASQTQTPARARGASAPRLKLDDYLRRRSGRSDE